MDSLKEIAEQYGFKSEVFKVIRESSDNRVYLIDENDKYVLRIGKKLSIEDVCFEHEVAEYLRKGGVPVPRWKKNRKGEYWTETSSGEVAVAFEHIEGFHVVSDREHKPSEGQVRVAGKMLGTLSAVGLGYKSKAGRGRTIFSELERVFAHESDIIQSFKGGEAFVAEVREALSFAKNADGPKGIIHNDFRPHNVFFESDSKICGVIDFDWATTGLIQKDLAHSVLEWSFPDGIPQPHEVLFDAFLDGYNSTSPFPGKRGKELYEWICFSALSDVATYFCDRISDPALKKDIGRSYMYKKYLYFKNLCHEV
jgi:Ser/Thr protein kinase RdoA (MazF antagonist)